MTKNKIKRISFEVTGRCNLNCSYCCRGYLNNSRKIANEITTSEILEVISDARKSGVSSFLFTGGEAFVKEDLNVILEACLGCFVEIYSNGTLIANEKNKKLIEKYVSRLTVTLDGLESHNLYRIGSDYRKILKNIGEVKRFAPNVKIKINTLVHKRSVEELLEIYDLLKSLKVDEWHIDFPQLRGRLAGLDGEFCADYSRIGEIVGQLLSRFYKDGQPFYLKIYKIFSSKINESNFLDFSLDENPCAYKTDFSMFVNAEKKYILCPSIPSQDITITTISQSGLNEAIEFKSKLLFQNIKFSNLKECIDCRYFRLCAGGCRGEAKVISDSFFVPDLNSCALMAVAENQIYPELPEIFRKIYLNRIDFSKKFPKSISSLNVLKGENQEKYRDSN